MVLFLALATTNALVCPVIKCGANEGGLCYYYNQVNNTGVTTHCAADHTCNFDYSDLHKNYLCVEDPNPYEYNRWPGQKCSTSKICLNGTTCVKGYCVGLGLNQSCNKTDVCNPGYYCKIINAPGTCQPLIKEGQTCGDGDVCDYGHKCYSGVCKKQNVANGDPVDASSCMLDSNSYSELCKSSQCLKTTVGTTVTAICIAAYKVTGPTENCDTCTGASSGHPSVTTYCACGLKGNSQCHGFLGDTYQSKLISIEYDYRFGKSVKKCNINAGYACMEDYWDHDDYIEYLYYNLRGPDHYMLTGAQDCALKAVAAHYLSLKNEYEDSSSSSSSSFGQLFAISALVFTVVA